MSFETILQTIVDECGGGRSAALMGLDGIAIATADQLEGPYRHSKVLLTGRGPGHWDELMAHNPKLKRFGDKYYLYYKRYCWSTG